MFYIPPGYDATATPNPPTCTVDPTAGVAGDLVLSDVDPTLCPGVGAKPATLGDFPGPVNNMVFVVPSTSTQKAISAEMAYLVFGMGGSGGVDPWTDPTFFFIRAKDSGTRAMITSNISTTTHDWQGQAQGGSGPVFNNVAMQQNVQPEKTIGILGEDFYDQGSNRTSVKALAFRAFKQQKAYWPDSSITSRDKKNVRYGRYKIWGYVHMLATVASGTPTNAKAKYFIDLMQGKATAGFDIQDAITDSHLTPVCAMHVTHDIEGGDQKPYSADAPCDCSFVSRATGVAMPAGCTPCNAGACTTGVCRKGFCEAK
jgi:hypothetical protein